MHIILGLTFAFLWTTQSIIAAELDSQAVDTMDIIQPATGERGSHGVVVGSGTERTLAETHMAIAQSWVPNKNDFEKGKVLQSIQRGIENRATPKEKPASPVKPPAPKPPVPKPPVVKPAPANPPSTPIKPKPIKTCQQLAMADTSDMLVERGEEIEDVNPGTLHDLVKRARKPGTVCGGIQFNANDYPSRGIYIGRHPHKNYYGFANPYDCDNYVWRANSSVEPAGVPGSRTPGAGQTEHVMEWQSVTGFINWMSATRHAGRTFQNPDPTQNGQLSFCGYVTQYWDLNSRNHRFALLPGGQPLTPTQHLASAYPHNNVDELDFVLLQDKINSPAKAHMWDDSIPEIHGRDQGTNSMTALLTREPRTVVQRLRYVVGARKYQSDRDIAAIFVWMKNRIRAKLVQLDQALPANARPGFTPWDPTIGSLATAWDTYMDGAFLRAKAKQQRFMDKWIIKVRNQYCTPAMQTRWKTTVASDTQAVVDDKAEKRALCDSYNNLVKQWKGLGPWNRPW